MKLLDVGTKSHPGLFAKVDDVDFDHLNQWKWSAERRHKGFYAIRRNSKRGMVRMHREILGCAEDIDHEDGDGLNNQRYNLRPCSDAQNQWNSGKRHRHGKTSQYKGVNWSERFKCWVAYISANGERKNLGCFDTEEAAALAYNLGALDRHGNFAKINEGLSITQAQMDAARHRRAQHDAPQPSAP